VSRVIVVGDIITDIVAVHSGAIEVGSDSPASIRTGGGGSAANTAAWLAKAGVPVDLVGVMGTDAAGDDRLAELRAAGVGCAHIRRTPSRPTGTVIVLAHERERSMLTDRGANLLLRPSDVDSALGGPGAPGRVHVHLSGYVLLDPDSRTAGRHALAQAAQHRLSTSVDAASAAPLRSVGAAAFLDWIEGTDLLLANLDEARVLADDPGGEPAALARALRRTAANVVVKAGADGAVWAHDDQLVRVPARPTSAVDPTGAGDAFAAGLLAAWLARSTVEQSLRAGVTWGARAVSIVGGRPPTSPVPVTARR
jgi:ribokinase